MVVLEQPSPPIANSAGHEPRNRSPVGLCAVCRKLGGRVAEEVMGRWRLEPPTRHQPHRSTSRRYTGHLAVIELNARPGPSPGAVVGCSSTHSARRRRPRPTVGESDTSIESMIESREMHENDSKITESRTSAGLSIMTHQVHGFDHTRVREPARPRAWAHAALRLEASTLPCRCTAAGQSASVGLTPLGRRSSAAFTCLD